jgi:hypothetical protein
MKLKPVVLSTCLLLLSGLVLAGGWDVGPFDNDDALDWVWELTESDDLSSIDHALQTVLDTSDYIEAPDASMAVAAAEVVAALKGKPRAQLPDEVDVWVKDHDLIVDESTSQKARKAIELIMDDGSSELAQLWSDAPELADAWRADLANLLQRLQ